MQQLTLPLNFGLVPKISFDNALAAEEFSGKGRTIYLQEQIIERARQQLTLHEIRFLS